MRKNILILLLLILGSQVVNAQREETLFSDLDFTGFWFATSYNFSDFENDWALVRGWSLNFEFGRDLNLSWARYNIKDNVEVADGRAQFDLKYHGFMFAMAPNTYKALHPRISFLIGRGKADISGEEQDRVFVFQPSGGLELNITEYARLGVEGGYRFIGGSSFDAVANKDLSAPFIQLDLRFGFSWN